nr:TetR/AcrR family transcriptional regulator [uncultured Dongia sp.]
MPVIKQPNLHLTPRGAAMRSHILDAAADLIYAHGVDRTSVDEVLVKSKTSKSQFYHYFTDKDALVLDVIKIQTQRVLGLQQPHLEALNSLPALQRWRDAIVKLVKGRHRAGGCPVGSLANELANRSEDARTLLASSFEIWRSSIERGLREMQKRGELAASANPHDLALAILTALQGGLLLAKTMHTSRPVEVALDMSLEHVARHMTARQPRR